MLFHFHYLPKQRFIPMVNFTATSGDHDNSPELTKETDHKGRLETKYEGCSICTAKEGTVQVKYL